MTHTTPESAWRRFGGCASRASPGPAGQEASAAVAVDPDVEWPRDLAGPVGGTLLCHNDVCPEQVVFCGDRAAALIDFDLAALLD